MSLPSTESVRSRWPFGSKIGAASGFVVAAVPGVDYFAVVVDQVRHAAVQRRHQDIAGSSLRRVIQKQTDCLGLTARGELAEAAIPIAKKVKGPP